MQRTAEPPTSSHKLDFRELLNRKKRFPERWTIGLEPLLHHLVNIEAARGVVITVPKDP